jgi:Penicillin-insensitive murein endopeptidase
MAFCALIKRLERLSTRHSIKWPWSSGESKSLDNMQRAIVCLILILTPYGGMASEFALSGPANAPIANRASGKATPAKELFGAVTASAPLVSRAIGTYARGCLSGGVALPISGPNWQVMRLSRNRNWGQLENDAEQAHIFLAFDSPEGRQLFRICRLSRGAANPLASFTKKYLELLGATKDAKLESWRPS